MLGIAYGNGYIPVEKQIYSLPLWEIKSSRLTVHFDSITVNFLMERYHWALASVDFLFFNTYVFVWMCWVLVVAHRIFLHHAGSLIAVHGFPSCSVWAPECSCSTRLSCSWANGVLVP